MKVLKLYLLVLLLSAAGCGVTDNNPANKLTEIKLLNSYIRPENLAELLSNRFIDYSVPIRIFIGDEEFKGSIEAQGSGSRYLPKWSYEIDLDGKRISGLNEFNLSAQVGDPSMLKTLLTSGIYREMGFEVFESEFAFIKINEENKGLYYIIERIEPDFFNRRNIPVYEVIKTLYGARFTLKGNDNLYEFFEKEINDDDNLYNFENLIYAIDTVQQENIFMGLGKLLDINSYLKYHAISSVIAAKDGFRNNIIFYKPLAENPYEILPWDFDGAFNSTFTELFYGDNELIYKLLSNDSCFSLYKGYYLDCLENIFTETNLFPLIDKGIEKIKKAYSLDPYLGESGYNLDIEAEKLKNFISQRRELIISNLLNFRKP